MMSNLPVIRKILDHACLEINPSGEWPLDMNKVLSRLGIQLYYTIDTNKRGKAYLQLSDKPVIYLVQENSKEPRFGVQERFSVAHELAHWVLWCRLGILPSSTADYWRHEELCNEFAAKVLVSPGSLEAFVKHSLQNKVNPVYLPDRVAEVAGVSWDVAARSISELSSIDAGYIKLVVDAKTEGKHIGHSHAFRVATSSIKGNRGSYLAQNARFQNVVLNSFLRNLGIDNVAHRRVSLNLGKIALDDVNCTFLRQHSGWTMFFPISARGVTAPLHRNAIDLNTSIGPTQSPPPIPISKISGV